MQRKEFAKIAGAIKSAYPKERILDTPEALGLWYEMLKDISYNVMAAALQGWIATHKWSPSIAELREGALKIIQGTVPDWADAWSETMRLVRRHGAYNPSAAYAEMDEITKATVQRMGYMSLCMSENIAVERANFRMIYERLAERAKEERMMPEKLIHMIEGCLHGEVENAGEDRQIEQKDGEDS